jgi:hypothetical protein
MVCCPAALQELLGALLLTVWHSAVATIFTLTSPGPGGSTVTVHTSSFLRESHAIAALQSMGLPAAAEKSCAMIAARTLLL